MIVLTAAQMQAAEEKAIAGGVPVETLMKRAGLAAADAIWRHFARQPVLVLCGPGNNGGDGYVIAEALRQRGAEVRIAADHPPDGTAARAAFDAWGGPIEPMKEARPASLLVDALFGTGLARPLDRRLSSRLVELAAKARFRVAIDLPSGVSSDDGAILSPVPDYDLTISFQTLKPAHRLQPAASHMGRLVVADIGIDVVDGDLQSIERPRLRTPGPDDHKYRRGYVSILAGTMPGAAALTASAAARSGAGYVRLIADKRIGRVPSAVVQSGERAKDLVFDPRIDCVVLGPGLGRGKEGMRLLDLALACGRPLVLDADALFLLAEHEAGKSSSTLEGAILTPHLGEFERLFPDLRGSKIERAREAAARSGAVILFKGADTLVAAPNGRVALAGPASHWLATAGTGDVLCGIVAALRAGGSTPFDAACSATWIHGRAAALAGPALIADDLVRCLPHAIADAL